MTTRSQGRTINQTETIRPGLMPAHGENPAPLQLPLDAFGLGMNDKAIHTGLCPGGSERMTRLMRLMQSGRIDPTPMTTHTFAFGDVGRAFDMMITKEDGIIKPLITFR